MANQIFEYVKEKRDTDEDCKKWWQLRKHVVVDKRIAKDKDYQSFLEVNEKLTEVILSHSKVTIVASTLNNTANKVLRKAFAPQLLLIDEARQSLEADNIIAMTVHHYEPSSSQVIRSSWPLRCFNAVDEEPICPSIVDISLHSACGAKISVPDANNQLSNASGYRRSTQPGSIRGPADKRPDYICSQPR